AVEVAQRACQVVDRREQQVLDRAGGGLDRGRRQRRLVAGREDDAVDARRLGAPEQRPDVLGILERIEDEHERGLRALDAAGEDFLDARPAARAGDEGDSLVTVEAGERGQRPAFELDDRDPQARRVENEALEGLAPLGDDEQPDRGPLRDERLLDGATAGDELLVGAEQAGVGRGRRPEPGLAIRTGARSIGRARTARSGSGSRWRRAAPRFGGLGATVVDVRTGPGSWPGSRWSRAA